MAMASTSRSSRRAASRSSTLRRSARMSAVAEDRDAVAAPPLRESDVDADEVHARRVARPRQSASLTVSSATFYVGPRTMKRVKINDATAQLSRTAPVGGMWRA